MNIHRLKEVKTGLLTETEVTSLLDGNHGMSYIAHDKNPLLLGSHALLKVNTNIGVSDKANLDIELQKLESIANLKYAPDLMMDHTIVHLEKPLWRYIIEYLDKPVGTLPHYTAYHSNDGIDKSRLLETIEEMGEAGVSFMTLHPTASLRMLEIAKKCRKIETTSRGGVLILKDAQINSRNINVIADYFDDIIDIFLKYDMTMSIGTTFRPMRIDEALDTAHCEEISEQGKYISYAKSRGINVIMEGIGHISLRDLLRYCELIKPFNTPLMPLGPMLTDATIGFDHVTSAIGATAVSLFGNVSTINSVTREEHTGGVPSVDSIIEGLKAARVAAHCINLYRFKKYGDIDKAISEKRSTSRTCVISGGIFDDELLDDTTEGCSRCSFECPLSLLK